LTEELDETTSPAVILSPPLITPSQNNKFMDYFAHVLQFCHLCHLGKISPVLYQVSSNLEVQAWFKSLKQEYELLPRNNSKCSKEHSIDSNSSGNESFSSPENKISKKDKYFLHAMLKINESVDKNLLHSTLEREEKEPGFSRLEPHRKNFILNASAIPPFESKVSKPTEFYTDFLAKKSLFKAKDFLAHRFTMNRISFNPGTSFISGLLHCDFFWTLPNTPSGVSIFFCPEIKSLNASELEKENHSQSQTK